MLRRVETVLSWRILQPRGMTWMVLLSKLSPLPSCFPNFHPQILLRQEVFSSCPNQYLYPPGRVLHLQLQERLRWRLSWGEARPTVHSHAATEPVAQDFVQCTQKYPGCEQNKRPLVSPPPQKALVLIAHSPSPEFPGQTAAGLQGNLGQTDQDICWAQQAQSTLLPLASPGCSDPASSPDLLSVSPQLPPEASRAPAHPPHAEIVAARRQQVWIHAFRVRDPHELGGGVRVVEGVPADKLWTLFI